MNISLLSTKLLALSCLYLFFVSDADAQQFSALFAFGDSILDTGNNNNLLTKIRCNFPPYGKDFPGGIATGRYGNGRVLSDIIADGLGLKKLLPAYRDPSLSNNDIPTGVSFASGGSGLDLITSQFQDVISVGDQVNDFRAYITRLKTVRNENDANAIISNAVYLISAGNNDLAFTYSAEFLFKPLGSYTDDMVTWTESLLKSLYDLGARKFAVLGTLPLGCLPVTRLLLANLAGCLSNVNDEATMFNGKLSARLNNLQTTFPGAKFAYVDMYNSLYNLINNPQASGFTDVSDGCCCSPTSPLIPCPDASTYVFWDLAHPSEKSYQIIAPAIIGEIKQSLA